LVAWLQYSSFWSIVKKMHVTNDMRVRLQNNPTVAIISLVVNGTLPTNPETGKISFP